MLRLARFANYDYEPNIRLELSKSFKQVKVIVLRKIRASKEIIIFYNYNIFKIDNYNYLCKTYKPLPKSRLEKISYY
jgi:hypothetical protein